MLTIIGDVLAGLIGAGIIAVGFLAIFAPQNAKGFGIPNTPVEDAAFRAWLGVKAGRDIGLGVLTFIVLAGGTAHLLGWFMLAAAFMPVWDGVTVLRSKGPKAAAYGVHWATAAVMFVSAVLLLVA